MTGTERSDRPDTARRASETGMRGRERRARAIRNPAARSATAAVRAALTADRIEPEQRQADKRIGLEARLLF